MNKNDIVDRIKTIVLPMFTDAVEDQLINHWADNVQYHRDEDDGELVSSIKLEYKDHTYTVEWPNLYQSMVNMTQDRNINPHLRYEIGKILYQDELHTDYQVDVIFQYYVIGKLL